MLLKGIHLQNFRNIRLGAINFSGKSQFFVGPNAQGKTNLIEAVSLLMALRSFRTRDVRHLIQEGAIEAQVLYFIEHPREGELEVLIKIRAEEKGLYVNGVKIKRLLDFMGVVPVVVLSSEDMELLRGGPGVRRRFLDSVLAVMDRDYCEKLRRYDRAVQERNVLLRQYPVSVAMVEAYNGVLAPLGFSIYRKRVEGFGVLRDFVVRVYGEMVGGAEGVELVYRPDCELTSEEKFHEVLVREFERDRVLKSTQRGPHRDDFEFKIGSKRAIQYGSEGQQRGLVIALRLAQVEYFKHCSGLNPMILVDDVAGQLDLVRGREFWNTMGADFQVMGTGTVVPGFDTGRDWQVFDVLGGAFEERKLLKIKD